MKPRLWWAWIFGAVLAWPAFAGSLLAIRPTGSQVGQEQKTLRKIDMDVALADQLGINMTTLEARSVANDNGVLENMTWCARNATFDTPGEKRNFDAVWVMGWSFGGSMVTNITGWFTGDSLFHQYYWPKKPTLVTGPVTAVGFTVWSGCAACSTGTMNNELTDTAHLRMAYKPGTSIVYDTWDNQATFGMSPTPPTNKTYRVLQGKRTGVDTGVTGPKNCTNCFGVSTASPDSASAFEIYGDPSGSVNNPIVCAWPLANTGTIGVSWDAALSAAMLVHLDSLSGGVLIGQKPGWKKLRVRLLITRACGRSGSTGGGAGAAFPDANGSYALGLPSTDMADSLNSLVDHLGRPVPLSIGFNPDSTATYPDEVAWLKRVTAARFFPENTVGTVSGAPAGNSSFATPVDAVGLLRSRTMFASWPPYTCGASDTSYFCGIRAIMAGARLSPFAPKVGTALITAGEDYIPSNYSRGVMPDPDSLATALAAAGVTHVVFSGEQQNSSPGATRALDGTAYSAPGTGVGHVVGGNPWAYGPGTEALTAWSSSARSTRLGTVNFLRSRGRVVGGVTTALQTTHDFENEFIWGRLTGLWYWRDLPYYIHNFRYPLEVFTIPMGQFGDDGSGIKYRPGWWQLKCLVAKINYINSFAIRGREPIEFVYVDTP